MGHNACQECIEYMRRFTRQVLWKKRRKGDMKRLTAAIQPILEIVVGGVLGLAVGTVVGAAAGFFIARVWGII